MYSYIYILLMLPTLSLVCIPPLRLTNGICCRINETKFCPNPPATIVTAIHDLSLRRNVSTR